MNFTDVELKLLRLALNPAAAVGEIGTSAVKLIDSWRKRKLTPEEFSSGESDKIEYLKWRVGQLTISLSQSAEMEGRQLAELVELRGAMNACRSTMKNSENVTNSYETTTKNS
jgi:hypothetical protein